MKDGFIKTAAANIKIRPADCGYNTENIIAAAKDLCEKGVKLAVFPELCITGYTCQDLFYQNTLLNAAEISLKRIAKELAALSMISVVGVPLIFDGKLYNCAAVLYGGKILGIVPKQYLPNYNEFYELRHFAAWHEDSGAVTRNGVPFGAGLVFCCEECPDFTFGIEICEDLWSVVPPSCFLARRGANIIVNLSASNEMTGKADYRRELCANQSARLISGYVYASAGEGESTQDLVFGGHCMIAENGVLLGENALFSGENVISEIDVARLAFERRKNTAYTPLREKERITFSMPPCDTALTRYISPTPFIPHSDAEKDKRCALILDMQSNALKKRIEHTGVKAAVIGISGGLDSCLALLVTAHAMRLLSRPMTDIIAVTMPCFGTTKRTKSNAQKVCEALGTSFRDIDITDSVKQHFKDIGHDVDDLSVVFENAQARERTQLLMDIANKTNGLVIGTGDLSELALGWATYNGDHISMYGVNCSVPKTLVRHLVRYCCDTSDSEMLKEALKDILATPVSPELLPAKDGEISQKTEDLVGPYELHDFFLYYGLRWGFPPKKVYRIACRAFDGSYDSATIIKWLKVFYRRFFNQQFKRSCLPDGPKVGSVSLSPRGDLRMPSDAQSALWLSETETLG